MTAGSSLKTQNSVFAGDWVHNLLVVYGLPPNYSPPVLTLEEEHDLLQQVRDNINSPELKQRFIQQYIMLVVKEAKKYPLKGTFVAPTDLVQVALIDLWVNVLPKFDMSRGLRFSTYATFWIHRAMKRQLSTYERPIRIPEYVTEQLRLIEKVTVQLVRELGRYPSDSEIATEMGITLDKLYQLQDAAKPLVELDALQALDGKDSRLELIPDQRTLTRRSNDDEELAEMIFLAAKSCLQGREREVFQLYHVEGLSSKECISRLGCSDQNLRRILGNIKQKLRCKVFSMLRAGSP